MKQKQPQQSDSDKDVWEDLTKDIKKISRPEIIPSKPVIIKEINPTVDINKAYHGNKLDKLDLGVMDNIDNNTAKKFKREEFRIEATLDLHGCTEDNAYELVFDFVKKAYIQDKRAILIITGKGYHKEEDDIFVSKGILKERVPQWLNSLELRPLILSYMHPSAKNGGEGALYILLRRKR